MFTGPLARRCVKEGEVLPDENDRQWRVYVCAQNQLKKDMSLAKGTAVLHQVRMMNCDGMHAWALMLSTTTHAHHMCTHLKYKLYI